MPDQTMSCVDCGNEYTFTEKEQEYFKLKGLTTPKRCKPCRDIRRQQKERQGNR